MLEKSNYVWTWCNFLKNAINFIVQWPGPKEGWSSYELWVHFITITKFQIFLERFWIETQMMYKRIRLMFYFSFHATLKSLDYDSKQHFARSFLMQANFQFYLITRLCTNDWHKFLSATIGTTKVHTLIIQGMIISYI